MINQSHLKTTLLCLEAKRWIGVREEGSNNGQLIRIFQSAVGGQANEEPWCMSFAQYCIKMSVLTFSGLFPDEPPAPSPIFASEHCLTTWNRSQPQQSQTPALGALCIWQKYDGNKATSSGHSGVVTSLDDHGAICIIEGNTSGDSGVIERDGDGVYLKRYQLGQMDRGALRFKGFLRVW